MLLSTIIDSFEGHFYVCYKQRNAWGQGTECDELEKCVHNLVKIVNLCNELNQMGEYKKAWSQNPNKDGTDL